VGSSGAKEVGRGCDHERNWNFNVSKESRLGELPFPILIILYTIALYIDA